MQLEKNWTLPFPLDMVYAAWVSSDTVIPPATRMDVQPEVGGHYRLFMESPDFSATNEGEFLLVEAPHRVIYTWEWNADGEVTTIDVRFSSVAEGTQILLSHAGFSSSDSLTNHDNGWDAYMEGFVEHLATTT
ncbi:MAG: SRPBCC domain-containing protein [Pseudomonadota bacterium]